VDETVIKIRSEELGMRNKEKSDIRENRAT
jgi:hypothetical protein